MRLSLDRLWLSRSADATAHLIHRAHSWSRIIFHLLQFWTCIIVCELNPDVTCVPSLAIEAMPEIICSSPRYHYLFESHPCLSDEFGLFVVVEHRDFQLVVVGGIVDGEAQLLIPKASK